MKIESIVCETHTGEMFDHAIIVCVKSSTGVYYDLLFDAEGEPIPLHSYLARKVAAFYQIKFTDYKPINQNEPSTAV